jgi:hypothetical protein
VISAKTAHAWQRFSFLEVTKPPRRSCHVYANYRSHGQQRLQALLLIGHIAQGAKRLVGEAAKSAQLYLQLTSTCRIDRAELSVMMLAKRVIDSPTLLRKLKSAWPGWHVLRSQASAAINHAMAV